ncbi:hypothetical protein HanIR_Chr16g0838491 [Helianthus annuus]|nr:hypothetical protein HanIR_Chr16g0838491 [Helianthus annuus]
MFVPYIHPHYQIYLADHFLGACTRGNNFSPQFMPLARGYPNQFSYILAVNYAAGGGDEQRLMRLGSSATKEARKKRMARQSRTYFHHHHHHHKWKFLVEHPPDRISPVTVYQNKLPQTSFSLTIRDSILTRI